MSVNSLGSFVFIRMDCATRDGLPGLIRKQTSIVQRPGVPGTGVIDLASRGDPFQMETVVDVDSLALAETLRSNYEASIVADKYILTRADIDYEEEHGVRYVVLDVPNVSISPLATAVGGTTAGNHLVRAVWILLPILPDPPEEP